MDKAKRGYQEKKQILLKHVETEKTLTTQAKQLMDVANIATKDVHKLHETISRRKDYDHNNREACKNLDTNLNAHLKTIKSNINDYKSTLNEQTLSLINKMGKKVELICDSNELELIVNVRVLFRHQYKTKQGTLYDNVIKLRYIDRC